jgi:hypothetical protein
MAQNTKTSNKKVKKQKVLLKKVEKCFSLLVRVSLRGLRIGV